MFCQISSFMDSYLAKQPRDRRKADITQYCLLVMVEKCKSTANNGKCLRGLLMDLSKAVDCLSHKIFMEKLHAYCFDLTALKLV